MDIHKDLTEEIVTEIAFAIRKLGGNPGADDHLHPAGQTIGIPNLGWYAFRHTYRTILDDLGTPIRVQQKLMRHFGCQDDYEPLRFCL